MKPTPVEKLLTTPKKEEPINVVDKPVEVTKKESKVCRFNITIGLRVIHKAFGEGTIVKLELGRIYVKFDDNSLKDDKIFQNPQAFEMGFLKLI